MDVLYQSQFDRYYLEQGSVVALGSFDGFHIGHMKLIRQTIELANDKDYKSVVYTFENHPSNVLKKNGTTKILINNNTKISLLEEIGMDILVLDLFDDRYAGMSPRDFIQDILVDKLNVKMAVIGNNYRFGYHGSGNTETMFAYGEKLGFDVVIVPSVMYKHKMVSSSLIREELKNGELDHVNRMLGRTFRIMGTVDYGKRLGRQLGFPTANIYPYQSQALPAYGVYATKVYFDGQCYKGVTNVGENPTTEDNSIPKVETHLLDFSGMIYGQVIEVEFIQRIRKENRFNSVAELYKQIGKDVVLAKKILAE